MAVRFACPHCGHRIAADEKYVGRRAQCAECKTIFTVPEPAEVAKSDLARPAAVSQAVASPAAPFEEIAVKRAMASTEDDIDMTPMIDVVFQLLIFFMVTAAFSQQKSLPMPVPEETTSASAAPASDDDVVTVRVAGDGALWVDDALAVSRHDLIAKLRKARGGSAAGAGRKRMLVLASHEARYEAVVTALDAGSAAGMEEVSLASDDEG